MFLINKQEILFTNNKYLCRFLIIFLANSNVNNYTDMNVNKDGNNTYGELQKYCLQDESICQLIVP